MFSTSMLRELTDPQTFRYGGVFSDPSSYYLNPTRIHSEIVRPRSQGSPNLFGQPNSKVDPLKFQVMVNVRHFRPDEIEVKTIDNCIIVHGRHEERVDEHGFISREFSRRYSIPDDVESDKVSSALGKDGILSIQAPRKIQEKLPKKGRNVPIVIQQHSSLEESKLVREPLRFVPQENGV